MPTLKKDDSILILNAHGHFGRRTEETNKLKKKRIKIPAGRWLVYLLGGVVEVGGDGHEEDVGQHTDPCPPLVHKTPLHLSL